MVTGGKGRQVLERNTMSSGLGFSPGKHNGKDE